MIMITRGRFTQSYFRAFIAAPEDREAAMRRLAEASGSKLLGFYFTAGDTDFLMITDTSSPDMVAATSMAVASTGMTTDMSTLRGWTCAEFKAMGEMAGEILAAYQMPGRA